MRILQIIPTLDRGGAEKQLSLLASGLKARGLDIHVCCLTRGGPLQAALDAAQVPYHIVGKRWKIDPLSYFRLKSHIARLKPDLVHTWLFAANSYGRHAALATGVKHVLAGERCVDPWKRWHEFAIDRYLAKRTEKIVTNSGGVKAFYAQNGLPESKFVIIPNGIDATTPPLRDRNEIARELQIPPESKWIAAVGRLWPQKRLKDLIWAADLVKCVRDDTHLLIVGEGPQRESLERYARLCEITDRVHFVGERKDVGQLLPHMECLWLASEYEGQSNAIMEAMVAGIPVIATNIPGNDELVVHESTGFLVPLGDRAEFASRTVQILEDESLKKRLGAAGRERITTEFTVQKMVDRHEQLYRSLAP